MASSPSALSPRPNPPGSSTARGLALLGGSNGGHHSHHSHHAPAAAPAPAPPGSPGHGAQDLAEQMNEAVRSQFVSGAKLGEGTYAIVTAAHYRHNPAALVAIKMIKLNADFTDGIALDAIREIRFLSELAHPNIVTLHAVFSTKDQNLSLVLEYLPRGDLEQLWKNHDITYGPADIKAWANMLCQGIWFCHANYVLHRDIKGSNALIAADGTVKLADFGLARTFGDPGEKMTAVTITRMYRPPELFYGCRHYSGTVDMWSIGVVIAELAIRNWFLGSDTDIRQLAVIIETFGTPTEHTWPGVSSLPLYVPPANGAKPAPKLAWWKARFPLLGDEGIDLLRGLLTMDPQKRFTATIALQHKYWISMPRPTRKENLPCEAGREKQTADDLKRKGGEAPADGRADKVARKLDFSAMC